MSINFITLKKSNNLRRLNSICFSHKFILHTRMLLLATQGRWIFHSHSSIGCEACRSGKQSVPLHFVCHTYRHTIVATSHTAAMVLQSKPERH